MTSEPTLPGDRDDPGLSSVANYLLFGLSLPERALRSGVGVVGGALRESTRMLVPQAFRSSKTYSVLVQQMLDFMVEDIGRVERAPGEATGEDARVENFVARKTVGNFVEMASMASLHLSPLMVLAVVSDLAYGSKTYLRELATELKEQGVIDENSTINRIEDLLQAVASTSEKTATVFDTPPLSVEALRATVDETRAELNRVDPTSILPQAEIRRLWEEMRSTAQRENVGMLAVSTAMTLYAVDKVATVGKGTLSSLRVAGKLLDRHLIDHYETALTDIRNNGLYATLAKVSGPYIEAVWRNFSTEQTTTTEDLLSGRTAGRVWQSMSRWLGWGDASVGDPPPAPEPPAPDDT